MEKDLREEFNRASESRIEKILDRLAKVPEGEAIVDFLKGHKVSFDLQDDPADWVASTSTIVDVKLGRYVYKDPKIILKKDLSDDNLLQAIVHESEHIRQHFAGVGNPDRILSKEEYILFYRASEADAQAVCTHVTWKLKQAGDAGPWDAAAHVGYEDICAAYEKAVAEDAESADDGRAMRAAFDAWFGKTERLAGYNKATVDNMIPFLEKGRTEIFAKHGLKEGRLDATWEAVLHRVSPFPYLSHDGARDLLADAFYTRDMDARPPEKEKKKDANGPVPPSAAPPSHGTGPAP